MSKKTESRNSLKVRSYSFLKYFKRLRKHSQCMLQLDQRWLWENISWLNHQTLRYWISLWTKVILMLELQESPLIHPKSSTNNQIRKTWQYWMPSQKMKPRRLGNPIRIWNRSGDLTRESEIEALVRIRTMRKWRQLWTRSMKTSPC